MTFEHAQAIDRFMAEPRAQMLDELVRDATVLAPVFPRLPQSRIGRCARNEIARTQLDAAHGFRQIQRRQLLPEQLREVLRIGGGRSKAQHATRARDSSMFQKTGDLRDAALTNLEKLAQLFEQ